MSDVNVRFGADTGEFDSGAKDVDAELTGIEQVLKGLIDAFAILGGAATGSFREIRTGAAEAGHQIKETAEGIKEFRETIAGIGEAVLAAFAVEQIAEFAKKMAETAEDLQHTAQTFGTSTARMQAFTAEMKALGVAPEAAIAAFPRLDRAMTTAREGSKQLQEVFKTLGINLNEPMSQLESFQRTIEGLAKIKDVSTRVGTAMQVMGRNIREIAPLIGVTDEQLEEAKHTAEEYSAGTDQATGSLREFVDEAEGRGLALAESFNTNKVAMQGLNNVMTDALAPTFKVITDGWNGLIRSFIDSYREGGFVKQMFDAITAALQLLITVVSTAWSGFQQFFKFLEAGWRDLVAIAGAAGIIMYDAMTGQGGKAMADGTAFFNQWHAKAVDSFQDVMKEGKKWHDYMTEIWSKPAVAPTAPDAKAGKPPKTQTKKTGEESAYEELQEKLLALKNTHDGVIHDMQATELAFWKAVEDGAIKASKPLTAKEAAQVRMQVQKLEQEQYEQGLKEKVQADKDAAANAVQDAKDEAARKKELIEQEIDNVRDAEKAHQISKQEANSRILALINQEKTAAVSAAITEVQARQNADRQIMAMSDKNTAEYKAALKDMEAAQRQFNQQMVAADAQADKQIQAQHRQLVDQMRQQWHSYIDPTIQATGSAFKGLITGAKTWQQAMAQIGESILDTFINIGERMVENWIVNLIVQKTMQSTTGVAQVLSNAAIAASAAFASTAAIPIVGPELAPAAATAAYAATAAWAPLASAYGGWGEVPYDGAMTELHKKEMVLPADIATPLRDSLRNGISLPSSSGLQAAAAKAGSVARESTGAMHMHATYSPTINGQTGNLGDMLKNGHNELQSALVNLGRTGRLTKVFKAAKQGGA